MKIKSAEFISSCVDVRSFPKQLLPEIAFVGRSNVGKSTLMNRLLNRHALVKVSGTPGKTQTINFFLINKAFYFVDLPGYGFAKVPETIRLSWKKMIENYLSRRENLVGVVLLIDIRRSPMKEDLQMKDWLASFQIPALMVATKSDKLKTGQKIKSLAMIYDTYQAEQIIPFSSLTDEGKEEIWKSLSRLMRDAPQAHLAAGGGSGE
ncbi:MAG: YihA family ribosome biogenesis GTP-binding protein [Nitrospirae bacterium]|nr:YihA family ribosome biogenesis GTP-binding protein [Nitrospirota bacterium]MBI3594007.1 YihA family ribosome biogenesis GTP-binding protein [Nitrospirota bacterium]